MGTVEINKLGINPKKNTRLNNNTSFNTFEVTNYLGIVLFFNSFINKLSMLEIVKLTKHYILICKAGTPNRMNKKQRHFFVSTHLFTYITYTASI